MRQLHGPRGRRLNPVVSAFAIQVDGQNIETVESLGRIEALHRYSWRSGKNTACNVGSARPGC